MVSVKAPHPVAERGPEAPTRSVRRATARRASSRRAWARTRKPDDDTRIMAFLGCHPGSTTGDLARGLNLHPDHVAVCLAQLTSTGEILRTAHGYETP